MDTKYGNANGYSKRRPLRTFLYNKNSPYICPGEMAERSIAAVLKTVEVRASGGSNPSLSANPMMCSLPKAAFLMQ